MSIVAAVLAPAALAVAALGMVAAVARRPVRARLTVTSEAVQVALPGLESVATLVRRAQMPLAAVTAARIVAGDQAQVSGLRVGTAAPPWIYAGRFRRREGWDLVDVRRRRRVLELCFAPGGAWRRWLLELPEPGAALAALRSATGGRVGGQN